MFRKEPAASTLLPWRWRQQYLFLYYPLPHTLFNYYCIKFNEVVFDWFCHFLLLYCTYLPYVNVIVLVFLFFFFFCVLLFRLRYSIGKAVLMCVYKITGQWWETFWNQTACSKQDSGGSGGDNTNTACVCSANIFSVAIEDANIYKSITQY
jgi:hypothetical protein